MSTANSDRRAPPSSGVNGANDATHTPRWRWIALCRCPTWPGAAYHEIGCPCRLPRNEIGA